MEHRLGRTLRVFLIVLAAAGFYRLAVVPWVEPKVRDAAAALEMTPEEAAAIRARADRRLAALGDVFPPGAWEREDPIMLESRQMRLLFKDYHSLPDGRVHLVPCTLVVLPDRNRLAGNAGSGRTLVLRAPQGAALEFDEPLDLKQGRLAKLIGGSLRGQVTIRGTPTAPGAEDDIEIVTRDVELDELEVRTSEMVQFRYGRSSGSGRALVVRLRPRQANPDGKSGDHGPNIGGVDSIRIDRDVRMRLEGLAGGLLPGRRDEPQPPAGEPAAGPPPVHVNCRGSMCLNVSANVITLEDRVDVVRAAPDGATDQLACDLLAVLLARRESGVAAPTTGSGRGGLEPVEIQAKGRPVVAKSSGAELEARAERLGYEIATRRILLDGEQPVSLVAKGTEMEARKIDYCPGPPGDPGALMAVGPGWIKTHTDKSPPAQATWQQWLRMRPDPDGAGHVVSIAGNATVAVETRGRLNSAEMHLWLDVVKDAAAPPQPAASAGPDLSRVRPSRMLARGLVEADAPQVAARTDRLELWFRTEAAAAPPGTVGAAPANASAAAGPIAPATPVAQPAVPDRKLAVQAGLVRGLVVISAAGSRLEDLSMEGQVRLVEQPAAGAAEPGVEILGDQLQLSRAERFDARAVVSGRPAKVRGRGLDLEGPLVEFDRGRNRLTVDGAGTLALPLANGGSGLEAFGIAGPARPVAGPPGRLDVTWQGRLDFDGLTARFVDQVVAKTDATTVQAGTLDVVFDKPVQFGAAPRGGPQPDVVRVACGSKVRIESRATQADGGKSIEQLFVRDLVVDRVTGDVTGTGPGRLTSTRLGQPAAMSLPAGPSGAGVPAQPVTAPRRADQLNYLGVDFQRGMRGNLNRRMMEFHQRVEAIHGPVADWADTLDPHAPGGLAAGVVRIASDVLSVGQTPPLPGQARATIELGAGGNVLVEGESFTARSARLTWSEAKELLVFEGDGRADAQLFRQLKAGAQPDSMASERILYWIRQNRVDVEGVRYLDLDRLPGATPGRGLPGGGGPAPLAPRPLPGT